MRVNLAAQVLSASVAAVLEEFGPPEAVETAKLCEMMDAFFDCLILRHLVFSAVCRVTVTCRVISTSWSLYCFGPLKFGEFPNQSPLLAMVLKAPVPYHIQNSSCLISCKVPVSESHSL